MNFDEIFNRLEDLNSRLEILENSGKQYNFEGLCSSAFNNEKKKGLNFSEAIKFFIEGNLIKRKGGCYILPGEIICLTFKDIMAKDWEVVEQLNL